MRKKNIRCITRLIRTLCNSKTLALKSQWEVGVLDQFHFGRIMHDDTVPLTVQNNNTGQHRVTQASHGLTLAPRRLAGPLPVGAAQADAAPDAHEAVPGFTLDAARRVEYVVADVLYEVAVLGRVELRARHGCNRKHVT